MPVEIDAGQALQDVPGLRPLDGNQRVAVARIHDGRIARFRRMLGDPGVIARDVAGVDDEQKVAGGKAIHQQIVDERALGRRQRRVMRLPHLQPARIVAGDVLHGGQRVLAGDLDLPHVRDVEQPRRRPHGVVLDGDARVLDGHVPAAKGHHPGAKGHMRGVQRSFFQGSGSRLGHEVTDVAGLWPERPAFARTLVSKLRRGGLGEQPLTVLCRSGWVKTTMRPHGAVVKV